MPTWPLLVLSLTLSGCWIVPDDAKPSVDMALAFSTQYNHRGMPQNKNGVAQPELGVQLPTTKDGTVDARVWGNMDLDDKVGDAWFPAGHGGRFSEIDLIGTDTHQLGDVTINTGIHHYILPFAAFFPFGPRGSTTEVFAHASTPVFGAVPFVEVRYDFDQADGFYFRGGSSESFALANDWTLDVAGHIGYSTAPVSFWNYGVHERGFADLQGSAAIAYAVDKHSTINLTLAGVTMVDDDLRRQFDSGNINKTNYWVALQFAWRY